MKKNLVWIIAIVLVLVMAFSFALVGCDNAETPSNNNNNNNNNNNQSGDDGKITITWYNGSAELKVEKIDKGGKATNWTPDVADGKAFGGWYKEASKTIEFDFDAVLNEDTDIFADIYDNTYVEDTTSYYLIGTGAGDMGKAAWSHDNAAANLTMEKQDVENENVYSITITMYAGDRFQICHDGSWDGQFGIGGFKDAEYCDGVNPGDSVEYTADDKKCARVMKDDAVIFEGYDEFNNSFEVWNAILAEGQDGKYTITLHTFPNAPAKKYIEFELVEKVEALTETHKMYFIGTMNAWSSEYEEDSPLALAKSEDGKTFTGFITITEDDYADWTADANDGEECAAFKVYNTVDGQYYGIDGDNILVSAGIYAVRYTVENNDVEFESLCYYVVGTFLDEDENAVNFAVEDGVTPIMDENDGVATVELTAVDVTGKSDFSWIADQGKPGKMAIKVVYGASLGIKDWYSAEGGDNFYLEPGDYTVSLNIESGEVTVNAKE